MYIMRYGLLVKLETSMIEGVLTEFPLPSDSHDARLVINKQIYSIFLSLLTQYWNLVVANQSLEAAYRRSGALWLQHLVLELRESL